MVPKKVKITRIEDGIKKDYILRRFEKRDVDRIFQAWNNPQSYRYNSVDWCKRNVESIVDLPWPSDWGMYFMVLEDICTGEILSTCRFGGNPEETKPVWDFGYCTFRGDDKELYTLGDIREVLENGVKTDIKCWGKGYSSMMLDAIIKIAQDEGVYEIISGADGRNLGSQKVMMKNGMTFSEFEDDGDVEFSIKLRGDNGDILPINKPTKEKLDDMWENHMDMVKIKLSDKNIKKLIECSDEKLMGEYIMYLLLNRASIMGEVKSQKRISKDIKEIYLQLTKEEKTKFLVSFKDFKSRWQRRLYNPDFDEQDVKFNLNCWNIVDSEISKIPLSNI